jgi:hypothetical protein
VTRSDKWLAVGVISYLARHLYRERRKQRAAPDQPAGGPR